jgi:hypothetical protein
MSEASPECASKQTSARVTFNGQRGSLIAISIGSTVIHSQAQPMHQRCLAAIEASTAQDATQTAHCATDPRPSRASARP